MQGIKAIKPRTFDVFFVCDCCNHEKSYSVETSLSPDTEHNEILNELIMYRPFPCDECGDDSMGVLGYEELQ